MAMSDVMQLRAKAKARGISGYKAMNADELRKALGSSNGAGTKSAAKAAVSSAPVKGKKTAGRKTASVKSAPAKATAKRQTTGAKKVAKSTPKAEQPKRGRPAKAQVNGVSKNYHGGRNLIDNSEVDWTIPWEVSGIRGEIFKALRKAKGDTDKTYEALKDRATEFWKKNRAGERILKDRALAILRWNISRVKFDYVIATKQHKVSKKFGTLGTTEKLKKGKKSTPAKAKAQKAAQKPTGAKRGRPPGSKNKKTAGKKTAGRK